VTTPCACFTWNVISLLRHREHAAAPARSGGGRREEVFDSEITETPRGNGQRGVRTPDGGERPEALRTVESHERYGQIVGSPVSGRRNESDAVPRTNHLQCRRLVSFTNDRGTRSGLSEQLVEQHPRPVAGAAGDERLVEEFADADMAAAGEEMRIRNGQQYVLAAQFDRAQRRPGQRLRGEADVNVTGTQLLCHLVGVGLQKSYPHARVFCANLGEQLGEREQGLGGDHYRAVAKAYRVREVTPCVAEFDEHPVDMAEKGRAEPVEPYLAPLTVEQRNAEFGFESGDRATQRGLGDSEFLGGSDDVLVRRDDLEVAQRQ